MYMIFSRLASLFLNRNSLVVIGLLSVIAIIWYAGPHVGLTGRVARFAVIGAVVGMVVLFLVVRAVVYKIRGKRLAKEIVDGDDNDSRAEVEEIRHKLREAISSIRSSSIGLKYKGQAALYALPWYMVIGPSAAGKTSMVRNSGLEFPVSQNREIDLRGIEGTRNCDWWFSSEAIFLDTSGRYTSSDDCDDEWHGFLSMLRQHRPKQPVSGIIVVLPLPEIVANTDSGVADHVKTIRRRINELITELGFIFPVYIIFSKCDLLDGFASYFSDISDCDRDRALGFHMIDGDDSEIIKHSHAEIDTLTSLVKQFRIHKLSRAMNLREKQRIHGFTYDFSLAMQKIGRFIEMLIRDNPYQESPAYKGVYLTSSIQSGMPLQCVIDSIGQSFSSSAETPEDRNADESRSYFVHDLFKKVIVGARELPFRNRKRLRTIKTLRRISMAAISLIMATTVVFMAISWKRNRDLLDSVSALVSERGGIADLASLSSAYDLLSSLYSFRKKLARLNTERPLSYGSGLYQGFILAELIDSMQFHLVDIIVRTKYAGYLKNKLIASHTDWLKSSEVRREKIRDEYYAALRQYLMLYHTNRMDTHEFSTHLAAYISAKGDMNPRIATILSRLYARMISGRKARIQIDSSIVALARKDLSKVPDARYVYERIRQEGIRRMGSTSLQELVNADRGSAYISSYRIPVLFTHDGWNRYMKASLAKIGARGVIDDWVVRGETGHAGMMGNAIENAARLRKFIEDIRGHYAREYARHWQSLLLRAHLRGSSAGKLAVMESLERITAKNSDYTYLIKAIYRHLSIRVESRRRGGKNTTRLLLARYYPGLVRFLQASMDKKHHAAYTSLIRKLQDEFNYVTSSPDSDHQAVRLTMQILTGQGRNSEIYNAFLRTRSMSTGLDSRSRRILAHIMTIPVSGVWNRYLAMSRRNLQQSWRNHVYRHYISKIARRFPFSDAAEEVRLADLGDFMAPGGGKLWNFFNTHIRPFLVMRGGRWKPRKWLGQGIGFSADFLRSIRAADNLTKVLFSGSKQKPGLFFYVNPVPTPGIQQVVLRINGQSYEYRNYPGEWRRFEWPAANPVAGASLKAVSTENNHHVVLDKRGEWALFHLLKAARLRHQGANVYLTTWRMRMVNGRHVNVMFRIRTGGNGNMFNILDNNMVLPELLFKRRQIALRH